MHGFVIRGSPWHVNQFSQCQKMKRRGQYQGSGIKSGDGQAGSVAIDIVRPGSLVGWLAGVNVECY